MKAWEIGLQVMCSLHDAVYIIIDEDKATENENILRSVMRESTEKILGNDCIHIRIDTKTIHNNEIWIEEKGAKEFARIQKHLT